MFKQKEESKQDQPKHLEELTGSPGPTAVSDVAKGEKPQTLNEFDDSYHSMSSDVKSGHKSEMGEMGEAKSCHDIEEAYAMLFEGLAMIARSKGKPEMKPQMPIAIDD